MKQNGAFFILLTKPTLTVVSKALNSATDLAENRRDARLNLIGGCVESTAYMAHEAGRVVPECPVVVVVGSRAELFADDARHHGRVQLVQLRAINVIIRNCKLLFAKKWCHLVHRRFGVFKFEI